MAGGREIVLSGATGLVGGTLAASLAEAGWGVRALTRRPRTARFPSEVRAVGWNGLEVENSTLAWASAVIHLAGEPIFGGRLSRYRRHRIRESRVASTRSLVAALGRLSPAERPRTLICASAVGYYGSRGDEILEESAEPGEGFLADICVDWESAAQLARRHEVRVVCLRIGVVLAREGGALPRLLLPFRMGLGGRLGSGRQWFPWIHLQDLVALLHATIEDESWSGAVNATSPQAVTNADFTRALGEQLGRRTPLPVPAFALRSALGELSGELLGSRRVVPRVAHDRGFQFQHASLEGALADLLG